jgi:hypothetical protein
LVFGLLVVLESGGLAAAERVATAEQPAKRRPPRPPARPGAPSNGPTIHCAPQSEAETRIYRALEDPTVVEFVETPLQDVVDYLKDYHKIEIQLDKKALDDAGIGTDTPITRNLRGITLKSALRLMLREYNMASVVTNQVLMLTTDEVASKMLEICVYNVADLLGDRSTEELAQVVRQMMTPPEGAANPSDSSVLSYRHLLIIRHTKAGHHQVLENLQQMHRALGVFD